MYKALAIVLQKIGCTQLAIGLWNLCTYMWSSPCVCVLLYTYTPRKHTNYMKLPLVISYKSLSQTHTHTHTHTHTWRFHFHVLSMVMVSYIYMSKCTESTWSFLQCILYNALYFKDLPFPQYMSRVAYVWGKNKWEILLYVKSWMRQDIINVTLSTTCAWE